MRCETNLGRAIGGMHTIDSASRVRSITAEIEWAARGYFFGGIGVTRYAVVIDGDKISRFVDAACFERASEETRLLYYTALQY
jgi:hypothetical protein